MEHKLKGNEEEIISMRKSGSTLQEIAKKFGVSTPAVYYKIQRYQFIRGEGKLGTKYSRNYVVVNMRIEAIKIMGGRCERCGFDDIRALQIDHVNGGGNKERKSIGTYNILKSIIESPLFSVGKYQVLCANCNWIKKSENHEDNHLYYLESNIEDD